MVDLSDSYAKIERADEHVRYLAGYVSDIRKSRPYKITRHKNPQTPRGAGGNVLFLVKPDDEAIRRHLTRVGVIVGEVVYHLRSSLNHLVYRLTPSGGVTTKTEFPIFHDRQKYETGSIAKIKGIPPRAATLIEQAQPYHRHGIHDPLWLVHDLNIADKHHVLLVMAGIVDYPRPPIIDQRGRTIHRRAYVQLGDNTAIPADLAPEMDVNTEIPIEIVFTEPAFLKDKPVVPRLTQFVEAVGFVIDQFK